MDVLQHRTLQVLLMVAGALGFTGYAQAQAAVPVAASSAGENKLYVIDLPTTLRLAKADNLDVQLARERISEAKANHAAAVAKFLPWITAGAGYRRHEGRTQAVDGTLVDADKQSSSIGPMITAQVDVGDALFSTLAAHQVVNAETAALLAQQQDSTLQAASSYFDLLKERMLVGVTQDALTTSQQYEQQIHGAVMAGIVFKGDELRVHTQTERYVLALNQAQQQQRLSAVHLAELLHLDPSIELLPQDSELVPLVLAETETALDTLMTKALSVRAELKQSAALAEAARAARKNAVYGPLIPSLGVQAFVGEFGGGRGDSSGNFGSSKDYYVGLSWRLGPGGLFDFSRIGASNSRLRRAELNVEKVSSGIKRQVVESQARVKFSVEQMNASRDALGAATETLRLTRERKQLGVGIVLEDIQAQQELVRARTEYLNAITEHNKAQYQLAKAIGSL